MRIWLVGVLLLGALFGAGCQEQSHSDDQRSAELAAEAQWRSKELIASRFTEQELLQEHRPKRAEASGYTPAQWSHLHRSFLRVLQIQAVLRESASPYYDGDLVLPQEAQR